MNQPSLAARLVMSLTGQGQVISVPRLFIKATNDHGAAVVLSQLIHWHDKMGREFYKSDESLAEECFVSPKQMTRIRGILEPLGVYSERKGIPRKMFYRVDLEQLTKVLESHIRPKVDTVHDPELHAESSTHIRPKVDTVHDQTEAQEQTKGSDIYKEHKTTKRLPRDYQETTGAPRQKTRDGLGEAYESFKELWNRGKPELSPLLADNQEVRTRLRPELKRLGLEELLRRAAAALVFVRADRFSSTERPCTPVTLLRHLDTYAEQGQALDAPSKSKRSKPHIPTTEEFMKQALAKGGYEE